MPHGSAPGNDAMPLSSRSMGAEDRRVTKVLIQERDERVKAIDEVRQVLEAEHNERVKSIADVHKALEAMQHQQQTMQQQHPSRGMSESSVEELHKAIKREEEERRHSMESMQRNMESMQRSIEDLAKKLASQSANVAPPTPSNQKAPTSSSSVVERDLREMRVFCTAIEEKMNKNQGQMDNHNRMIQQHNHQLQELFASTASLETRTTAVEESNRRGPTAGPPTNTVPATPPPAPAPAPANKGNSNSTSDAVVGHGMEVRLKKVEDYQSEQAQQLASLRSLVVEVHMNLLLHAVKASRIALRCTDLSKEERRLALQSLDAKERLVQEDISKISARFDLSGGGKLGALPGSEVLGPKSSSSGAGPTGALVYT